MKDVLAVKHTQLLANHSSGRLLQSAMIAMKKGQKIANYF